MISPPTHSVISSSNSSNKRGVESVPGDALGVEAEGRAGGADRSEGLVDKGAVRRARGEACERRPLEDERARVGRRRVAKEAVPRAVRAHCRARHARRREERGQQPLCDRLGVLQQRPAVRHRPRVRALGAARGNRVGAQQPAQHADRRLEQRHCQWLFLFLLFCAVACVAVVVFGCRVETLVEGARGEGDSVVKLGPVAEDSERVERVDERARPAACRNGLRRAVLGRVRCCAAAAQRQQLVARERTREVRVVRTVEELSHKTSGCTVSVAGRVVS